MMYPWTAVRVLTLAALICLCATPAMAQADKSDSTGTNPINFTNDWRVYFELQDLEGKGDNSQMIFTHEQRFPVGKKFQFRYRARYASLSLDPNANGQSMETTGIGDADVRLLWVPWVTGSQALAFGMEAFLDTASNVRLGSGKTSLGPQAFWVKFKPGLGAALIAPAYQYVQDIGGGNVRDCLDQLPATLRKKVAA